MTLRLPTCFRSVLVFVAVPLVSLACWICAAQAASEPSSPENSGVTDAATVLVIVGAEGEEEFGRMFTQWAQSWKETAGQAGAKFFQIGAATSAPVTVTDRDQLKTWLQSETTDGPQELWLILIGHGTFDGKEARFNLRGPDVTASELAEWLRPFKRPLAVINTASSSAPFLTRLSAPGRVVVTATRSGHEQNFARFGGYFAEAIGSLDADLDKDGQVSLLEAFLSAANRVAEFYKTEGRLATEHALLDDNGDGLGTQPDWFRGIRAIQKPEKGHSLDGTRAHQFHLVRSEQEQQIPPAVRARRDELELAVLRLREAKTDLPEEEYYRRLEELLLQLARLYEGDHGHAARPTARRAN
jgi:hypothetical protein